MSKTQLKGKVRVGCSGWSYKDWKGVFYPKGTKAGDYLEHYAKHFDTVEVDGSYYRAPSPSDCKRWAGVTPDGFTFALKFPKRIVHGGEPRDRNLDADKIWRWEKVGSLGESFVAATDELGQKRGPILLQCPRYPKRIFKEWQEFLDVLLPFLERLSGPQYVLKIRNGEWLTPDFLKTLRQAGISLALSDFRGPDGFERKTFPHVGDYLDNPAEVVTGSVAYVRLIGDRWTMEQMTTTWKEQIVPRTSDFQQWAGARLLRSPCHGPVNVGTGVGTSIRELAETIARLMTYTGRIEWDTSKSDGAPRKVLDVTRMEQVLGWKPRYSLEEGLKRTIDWYLANKEEADQRA